MLQPNDLEFVNPYFLRFSNFTFQGFLDITDLKKIEERALFSRDDYNFLHEHRHVLNNKFLHIAIPVNLKKTKALRYVIPVFTLNDPQSMFRFNQEERQIENPNSVNPYVVFFMGNDDISYGLRCHSAQELEDCLSLGADVGELDLMWFN